MANLPKTESIRELASFWDSHDVTDFESELVEVTEPIFERTPKQISQLPPTDDVLEIRLLSNEVSLIEQAAKLKGVSQEVLVREWILERLDTSAG